MPPPGAGGEAEGLTALTVMTSIKVLVDVTVV